MYGKVPLGRQIYYMIEKAEKIQEKKELGSDSDSSDDEDGGAGRRRGLGEEIIARPARPQLGAVFGGGAPRRRARAGRGRRGDPGGDV